MRRLILLALFFFVSFSLQAAPAVNLVADFFADHCFSCHDDLDTEGDVDLSSLSTTIGTEADAQVYLRVLDQLQADLMPPLKKTRPDVDRRAAVIRAIVGKLIDSDFADGYLQKLLLPEYGNYTDHNLLFSGVITEAPYTPARLWRLSPEIYAARAGRSAAKSNPFVYATRDNNFRDYAATSTVDQSTIETIIVSVNKKLDDELFKAAGGTEKIISFNQGENKSRTLKPDSTHRYAPFLFSDAPTAAQLSRFVNDEFNGIYRQAPTAAQREKYLGFLKQNTAAASQLEAMRATVLAMHLAPEAIYRFELGESSLSSSSRADSHGRLRLTENEIAFALAYALTDRSPTQSKNITAALEGGQLKTQAGVHATVLAMLNQPHNINLRSGAANLSFFPPNPRIPRFFREYFGYHHAPAIFKDDTRKQFEFPVRAPSAQIENQIVKDLDNLIHYIVDRDKNVLSELLTTDRFLISHPGDNALVKERHAEFLSQLRDNTFKNANIKREAIKALENDLNPYPGTGRQFAQVLLYNLPHNKNGYQQAWSYPLTQPVEIPNRKGILTHPAWLWATSSNFDNDPIHRGIFIQTKLLAGVIADVPPDVDARIPEDPHKTLRQRLGIIREKDCWKCHVKINPLGEPFEIFDDFGRYRTQLYFDQNRELVTRRDKTFDALLASDQLTTKPIDATGHLQNIEPHLQGPVENAFDLIGRLAQSDRVRQSFVRHAFRYFLGRNEMLSDSKTLIAADVAYTDSQGSFKSLVASLLASDSFLYRR